MSLTNKKRNRFIVFVSVDAKCRLQDALSSFRIGLVSLGLWGCIWVMNLTNKMCFTCQFWIINQVARFAKVYHIFSFIVLIRSTVEASTPFLNIRWYLDKLGMKKSRIYQWNGYVLLATFAVFRVLNIIPFWYEMYAASCQPNYTSIPLLYRVCSILLGKT